MKYIDMASSGNLADEYAGKQGNNDIVNTYGDMQVQLSPDKDEMEEHLENNYKQAISLDEISNDDITDIKAIYRQLKRLKFCVQNLKYKLAITYKNYICAIRRDDSIDCIMIKNYPRDPVKQLLVIVDLETLYEKEDKLLEDIQVVRESIYKVIERNQTNHGKIIERIIENKKDILVIPQLAERKKEKYETMLKQLETMLQKMSESEKKYLDELYEIDGANTQGLENDINRVHHKARIEKELDKINSIRASISKNILTLRSKRENAILNIDKIVFDNTVMFDRIVKNFAHLKDFC